MKELFFLPLAICNKVHFPCTFDVLVIWGTRFLPDKWRKHFIGPYPTGRRRDPKADKHEMSVVMADGIICTVWVGGCLIDPLAFLARNGWTFPVLQSLAFNGRSRKIIIIIRLVA